MSNVPVLIYRGLSSPFNHDLWSDMSHRPSSEMNPHIYSGKHYHPQLSKPYWTFTPNQAKNHLDHTIAASHSWPMSISPDCFLSPVKSHQPQCVSKSALTNCWHDFDGSINCSSYQNHVPHTASTNPCIEADIHSTYERNSDPILMILKDALKRHDRTRQNKENIRCKDRQEDQKTPQKVPEMQNSISLWRHVFDCSMFGPNNIFVKILNGHVIVRGEKKEPTKNSHISSTITENTIQLPQNVVPGKVRCKMGPDQKLVIQAPVMPGLKQKCVILPKETNQKSKSISVAKSTDDYKVREKEEGHLLNADNAKEVVQNADLEMTQKCDQTTSPSQKLDLDAEQENYPENTDKLSRLEMHDANLNTSMSHDTLFTTSQENDNSFVPLGEEGLHNKSLFHIEDKIEHNENHTVSTEKHDHTVGFNDESQDVDTEPHNSQPDNISIPENGNDVPSRKLDLSKEAFCVRLEFPCHMPETIRVTMDDHRRILHIIAGKDGDFAPHKIVPVPEIVDETQLKCHFKDGILSISAPHKALPTNTRDIRIAM